MTTRATIARKLRNRVADLDALRIRTVGPFLFTVEISSKSGRPFDELKDEVGRVLRAESAAHVLFEIVPYQEDGTSPGQRLPPSLILAGYACDQTEEGLRRGLIDVVHDVAKVFIEAAPSSAPTVFVAREDGTCPPDLLDRVRVAIGELGQAGVPFDVQPVDATNPRHHSMDRCGFLVPSRAPRLVEFTEEEEHGYVGRIRGLLDGKSENLPQLKAEDETRLYVTLGAGALEIGALLPLYGQVYVDMPLQRDESHYYENAFGLSQDDFLALCRAGVVVPIFGHNLGLYPEPVWRTWLEDPSLPLLSRRDIDFVAMKYLWEVGTHLREIREDATLLGSLDKSMSYLLGNGDRLRANRWIYEYFGWLRMGAEEFEGLAFHRGRMLLANLSPGGALAHNISLLDEKLFASKAAAQTLAIDAFDASQNLAMAHALGASLCDGMVLNDHILREVARMFQEAVEVQDRLQTRTLTEVVKSLELHHSARIPINEYLDIMDRHEVRRIRTLVQELHADLNPSAKIGELRDRVQELNREVAKVERRAIDITTADVLGDSASGIGAVSGGAAYGLSIVAKLLGGTIAKEVASRTVNAALDGEAGAAIDRVRGMLNGVSGQAIRIYRVRNKLRR